jgi:hypothetical protein
MKLPIIATLTLLNLVNFGCGRQEVTPAGAATTAAPTSGLGNTNNDWSLMVATLAALPTCDAAGEGKLAFVKAEARFVTCTGGSWQTVEIKGKDGDSAKSPLLKSIAENPGANCVAGGTRVASGSDDNGNNTLDDNEVKSVSYACNGTTGISISAIWRFGNYAPGANELIGEISPVWEVYLTDIQLVKFSDGSGFLSLAGLYVASVIGNSQEGYDEHWSYSTFLPANKPYHIIKFKSQVIDNRIIAARVEFTEQPFFSAGVFNNSVPISPVKQFTVTKLNN